MCPLIFETIKWSGGLPFNLPWHQKRMEETFKRCGSVALVPDLASELGKCSPPQDEGVYKCHFTYNLAGEVFSPVFDSYTPRRIGSLVCVSDDDLDYSCKWEDRQALNALGEGLSLDSEVLIIQRGFITDTRYSNVVFGDGEAWVTPDTYLLPGTKRAALLQNRLIGAASLKPGDWKNFRYCSLINAMLDPGEVVIETSKIYF